MISKIFSGNSSQDFQIFDCVPIVCIPFLFSLTSFIMGKVASPYIAIANGSPCVVHSLDRVTFLFTKSLDGLEYELSIAGSIEGHTFAMFFKARFRFWELNEFSASISNIASKYVFSYCFLSV